MRICDFCMLVDLAQNCFLIIFRYPLGPGTQSRSSLLFRRSRARAAQLWGMLAPTLKAALLSAQDRSLLWRSVSAAVQLIADERELRLSPPEVSWVTSVGCGGYCRGWWRGLTTFLFRFSVE